MLHRHACRQNTCTHKIDRKKIKQAKTYQNPPHKWRSEQTRKRQETSKQSKRRQEVYKILLSLFCVGGSWVWASPDVWSLELVRLCWREQFSFASRDGFHIASYFRDGTLSGLNLHRPWACRDSLSSDVHPSSCVWKTLFPPSPLALRIFPSPRPNRSLSLEGSQTVHFIKHYALIISSPWICHKVF